MNEWVLRKTCRGDKRFSIQLCRGDYTCRKADALLVVRKRSAWTWSWLVATEAAMLRMPFGSYSHTPEAAQRKAEAAYEKYVESARR